MIWERIWDKIALAWFLRRKKLSLQVLGWRSFLGIKTIHGLKCEVIHSFKKQFVLQLCVLGIKNQFVLQLCVDKQRWKTWHFAVQFALKTFPQNENWKITVTFMNFVQPWLMIHFVFYWIEGLVSIIHIMAALGKHSPILILPFALSTLEKNHLQIFENSGGHFQIRSSNDNTPPWNF